MTTLPLRSEHSLPNSLKAGALGKLGKAGRLPPFRKMPEDGTFCTLFQFWEKAASMDVFPKGRFSCTSFQLQGRQRGGGGMRCRKPQTSVTGQGVCSFTSTWLLGRFTAFSGAGTGCGKAPALSGWRWWLSEDCKGCMQPLQACGIVWTILDLHDPDM